jgi:diazepam-binding inhibitor (GABA receptor modulating acyl-CoA-binding protein)
MAATPKKVDLKASFEAAAAAAKKTRKKPDNATLLKLYAYYKQATEGDVKGDRPGGFDFVGGAKHDAWAKLKGTTPDEAMTQYVKQVDKLNRD